MRTIFALAAAPLVLSLAACDTEPNPPDDRIVDIGETDPNAVEVELPEVPVETPTVPVTGDPDESAPDAPEE